MYIYIYITTNNLITSNADKDGAVSLWTQTAILTKPIGNYLTKQATLEFQIDGTPRLLIIRFFVTPANLIQHSPFINFGEFCQPPLLFQTPRLLIHVHSRQP